MKQFTPKKLVAKFIHDKVQSWLAQTPCPPAALDKPRTKDTAAKCKDAACKCKYTTAKREFSRVNIARLRTKWASIPPLSLPAPAAPGQPCAKDKTAIIKETTTKIARKPLRRGLLPPLSPPPPAVPGVVQRFDDGAWPRLLDHPICSIYPFAPCRRCCVMSKATPVFRR
jgi:hypothetical protein